jgi:energy-coupling factor transport system ATP-binding protein
MIVLKNVSYRYKNASRRSLEGIDLTIKRGKIVAVIGFNGAGKSTLVGVLSSLLPRSGLVKGSQLLLDGTDYKKLSEQELRRNVGVVLQNPSVQAVFATPYQDIAFMLGNFGVPSEEFLPKVRNALRRVGMTHAIYEDLREFSLGQKQRIAFASALALCPNYLVLDEVTSMLDSNGKMLILDTIQSLANLNVGIIFMTNNIDELLIADEVVILEDGAISEVIPKLQALDLASKLVAHGFSLTPYYQLVQSSASQKAEVGRK